MMFLWLLIIAVLVYYIAKGDVPLQVNKKPLDVLNERLAKGEITMEEYRRIKQTMEER